MYLIAFVRTETLQRNVSIDFGSIFLLHFIFCVCVNP